MKQPLSDETAKALTQLAEHLGTSCFTVNTPRLCDNCGDQDKEAFAYHVRDSQGRFWYDLCNDCYELLTRKQYEAVK